MPERERRGAYAQPQPQRKSSEQQELTRIEGRSLKLFSKADRHTFLKAIIVISFCAIIVLLAMLFWHNQKRLSNSVDKQIRAANVAVQDAASTLTEIKKKQESFFTDEMKQKFAQQYGLVRISEDSKHHATDGDGNKLEIPN